MKPHDHPIHTHPSFYIMGEDQKEFQKKQAAAKEEVKKLRDFFASVTLPEKINLVPYETWTDVKNGVEAHLRFLEHGDLHPYKRPYFARLRDLKNKLQP